MKIFPIFAIVTRNNEGEAKKEILQGLGFFLFHKRKLKTVENETWKASCALVGTTKGQVLLVKAVSNAWTFSLRQKVLFA